MDTIWDSNPSKPEVVGRCCGDKKTKWPSRKQQQPTHALLYYASMLYQGQLR